MRKNNLNNSLHILREFFFPILDPFTPEQLAKEEDRLKQWDHDNIYEKLSTVANTEYFEQSLMQSEKLSNDEVERLNKVEGKATRILGFSGVTISIAIGFTANISVDSITNWTSIIQLLPSLLAIIYLFISILYALKANKRGAYHKVGESDIIDSMHTDNMQKYLMAKYIECRVKNYKTINAKVDSMEMAFLYFKRALFSFLAVPLIYVLVKLFCVIKGLA